MRLHACLLILILLPASTASADIYKCVSDNGAVKFSDTPCATDAEVAFETEELNFDDVIGNASPYPNSPVPVSRFDIKDIVPHSKKIGQCIITGEYNNATHLRQAIGRKTNKWHVDLYFGPENEKLRFTVRMTYRVIHRIDNTVSVWLNTIRVKRYRKLYDPPSMDNVKTFKKMSVGLWEHKSK